MVKPLHPLLDVYRLLEILPVTQVKDLVTSARSPRVLATYYWDKVINWSNAKPC